MTTIGFLHTAEVHVATFRSLVAELAPPGVDDLHLVDEALLADARRTGSAPGLAGRLHELAAAGADLIVCTCSTIGADAEATGLGTPVMRLDRPMAQAAVAAAVSTAAAAATPVKTATGTDTATPAETPATVETAAAAATETEAAAPAETAAAAGGRIVVIATVESTLEPTTALIRATAESTGRWVTVTASPCLSAWRHFEAGDVAAYDEEIAEHVRAVAGDADVIVLAQAGMAGAAELLPGLPVLTSPRAAVEAALRRVLTTPAH